MLGELVDMDVVSVPTYDWAQSAGTALSMASRMTDGKVVLIPDNMSPDRASVIENYCSPGVEVRKVDYDPQTGKMDLGNLESLLSSSDVAAVYFENPSYPASSKTKEKRFHVSLTIKVLCPWLVSIPVRWESLLLLQITERISSVVNFNR